jgi:porphobilinogen deaminase
MIRIATHPTYQPLAEQAQAALRLAHLDSTLVLTHRATGIETLLLSGEADVAALPLPLVPVTLAHDLSQPLVIAALSERADAADCLVIRAEGWDESQIFKFKKNARAGCATRIQAAQLRAYRPDLDLIFVGPTDAPDDLAAQVVPFGQVASADERSAIRLHPQEFTPRAGQGVVAYLTHRHDLDTRRALRAIHHPEVALATNVERQVLQLLGQEMPLAVHAERDALGNYHVYAARQLATELRRVRQSSSTHDGLAQRVAAALAE